MEIQPNKKINLILKLNRCINKSNITKIGAIFLGLGLIFLISHFITFIVNIIGLSENIITYYFILLPLFLLWINEILPLDQIGIKRIFKILYKGIYYFIIFIILFYFFHAFVDFYIYPVGNIKWFHLIIFCPIFYTVAIFFTKEIIPWSKKNNLWAGIISSIILIFFANYRCQ